MPAAELIRERIDSIPLGVPFTSGSFLDIGSRAAVDHSLSRLTRAGAIHRLARGVFVRPRASRHVGTVLPGSRAVAQAVGQRSGATVQVSGAEAALELQLSTQVPVRPVFFTSGPSRRFRFGPTEVRLKHVSPRKIALAGRPAGIALTALWHLGKKQVDEAVIEHVRRRLPPQEFEALKSAIGLMPAWMANAIRRHARGAEVG